MPLTGGQIRAGRAFLGWSAKELAEKAGLGLSTVQRAEGAEGSPPITKANLATIRAALEAAGIEFVDGDAVRLRKAAASR
jgi:transcriptional regulator with XRE-family HTH domain